MESSIQKNNVFIARFKMLMIIDIIAWSFKRDFSCYPYIHNIPNGLCLGQRSHNV